MAVLALVNATTWVHGYDFTTDLNEVGLTFEVEDKDTTTFSATSTDVYRSRIGGLKSVEAELAGFWQSAASGAVDPESFPDLGVADRVVTMSGTGATETSIAYMFQAGKFAYSLFGEIGEVTPFSLSMLGTNNVGGVRGQIAKAKGNVSATGALGSAVNLGAVGASQFLYATFHVFTAGTTITVLLESDDDPGFGTPTTRATIGPLTTTGGTWAVRVAGALAETHYRLNVSAITGTFNVAGAIGIG